MKSRGIKHRRASNRREKSSGMKSRKASGKAAGTRGGGTGGKLYKAGKKKERKTK
jgi:hypothetical protein